MKLKDLVIGDFYYVNAETDWEGLTALKNTYRTRQLVAVASVKPMPPRYRRSTLVETPTFEFEGQTYKLRGYYFSESSGSRQMALFRVRQRDEDDYSDSLEVVPANQIRLTDADRWELVEKLEKQKAASDARADAIAADLADKTRRLRDLLPDGIGFSVNPSSAYRPAGSVKFNSIDELLSALEGRNE